MVISMDCEHDILPYPPLEERATGKINQLRGNHVPNMPICMLNAKVNECVVKIKCYDVVLVGCPSSHEVSAECMTEARRH